MQYHGAIPWFNSMVQYECRTTFCIPQSVVSYHTVVLFLIHLELPHFVVPYSGLFWDILECYRKLIRGYIVPHWGTFSDTKFCTPLVGYIGIAWIWYCYKFLWLYHFVKDKSNTRIDQGIGPRQVVIVVMVYSLVDIGQLLFTARRATPL